MKYEIFIFNFLNSINEKNFIINPFIIFEILLATLFSIIISIFLSNLIENDYTYKLARKFKLSNKSFSPGIIYDLYSKEELQKKYFERWVLLKIKSFPRFQYIGNITRWHFFEKDIDLLLERVTVYDLQDKLDYEIDSLALKLNYNDFVLEILNPKESEVN